MTSESSIPGRIARLSEMASSPRRRILGLMSGTSLDGLDLALCDIEGHGAATRLQVLEFTTAAYSSAQRERLRALAFRETVSLAELTRAHRWLAACHGDLAAAALERWNIARESVHCLASHGQTIYHAPADAADVPNGELQGEQATLQIGDGDQLAVRTGILVVSDFRQKEIALGGEGAPLAPYGDAILFGDPSRSRLLLNLGGIANFTWLPSSGGPAPAVSAVHGDTGPANTLIDRAVRRLLSGNPDGFDRDGILAAQGAVHAGLLHSLKAHPYFGRPCPKSTGPELFGEDYLDSALASINESLPPGDLIATLTRLTVDTIAETLHAERISLAGVEVLASGGGTHNATLMAGLRRLLPGALWRDTAEFGIPADAKEAVLFAVLANECLAGEGFAVPFGGMADNPGEPALSMHGNSQRRVGFGKISFPD